MRRREFIALLARRGTARRFVLVPARGSISPGEHDEIAVGIEEIAGRARRDRRRGGVALALEFARSLPEGDWSRSVG